MDNAFTAADFFAAKLAFQTDPSDLAADRAAGRAPVLIDVRSQSAWDQGHLPGAAHLPLAQLEAGIGEIAPHTQAPVVVYCWGPGCNGSTRGALALARLGYANVKELIGGYEYWAREGLLVIGERGRMRQEPDPLTAPAP